MRILISVLFVMLLVSMPAYADEVDDLKEYIDGNPVELPGFAKTVFGNERINVHIDDLDLHLVTEDGVVVEADRGSIEDNSLDVYASNETVTRIIESDDPAGELKEAFDKKEITYEATSVWGKIKYGIAGFVLRVFL